MTPKNNTRVHNNNNYSTLIYTDIKFEHIYKVFTDYITSQVEKYFYIL